MPLSRLPVDDSKVSLLEITKDHAQPIAALLFDIQQHRVSQEYFLRCFLRNLECFFIDAYNTQRTTLLRAWINAFKDRNFIALSYTWHPSYHENTKAGRYLIQKRSRDGFLRSPVRDCVLSRVTKYMEYKEVRLLWIDRLSIPQRECEQFNCKHSGCKRKRASLQSMDWVYKRSNHPVALLGRPMMSRRELKLLYEILIGKLIDGNSKTGPFRLLKRAGYKRRARDALKVLREIISDDWWQRAWPFQENYKGGERMTLLISHPRPWESQKRSYGVFGAIPGELSISSVRFSSQATIFCLAFRGTVHQSQEDKEAIECILRTAGRYKVLLDDSKPMFPTVIASIEEKAISNPWDRLAIVANCCGYPARLDVPNLRQQSYSLSLSLLAMCLLNGQILYNGLTSRSPGFMTVSNFLKTYCFDEFRPPRKRYSLTFNKGCRFTDAEITETGIRTKGHIWKLGQIIDSTCLNYRFPFIKDRNRKLSLREQQRLVQLSRELRSISQTSLANQLESYLMEDVASSRSFSFEEDYRLAMVKEITHAIMQGQRLRLGSSWDPNGGSSQCTAIFLWGNDRAIGSDKARFAFTSLKPKKAGFAGHDAVDVDRHVSLEVEMRAATGQNEGRIPHLYVQSWLPGLYFTGHPEEEVVFPWPSGLRDM